MNIPITTLEDFVRFREELGVTPADVSAQIRRPGLIEKVERGEVPYRNLYFLALLGHVFTDAELDDERL